MAATSVNLDFDQVIHLFNGSYSDPQRAGLQGCIDGWNKWSQSDDLRHPAYYLASVFHETGRRMMPLREGFAKDDATARRIVSSLSYGHPDDVTGFVYYGRGLVQITWGKNYERVGRAIGVDLYHSPDLALDPNYAAQIAVIGMERGLFSGKKLADYFNDATDDPIGARRIINGQDKADLIAGYHQSFLAALSA